MPQRTAACDVYDARRLTLYKSAASRQQQINGGETFVYGRSGRVQSQTKRRRRLYWTTQASPPAVTDLNLLRCPSNEPLSGNSPYRPICLLFFGVLSPGDFVRKNVFVRCSTQDVESTSPATKFFFRFKRLPDLKQLLQAFKKKKKSSTKVKEISHFLIYQHGFCCNVNVTILFFFITFEIVS